MMSTVTEQPATLDQHAVGIDQNNRDLKRQTNAFGYFREVCQQIETLQTHPNAEVNLPHIVVRIPNASGAQPENFEFDLNTLKPSPQYLAQMRPVFALLAQTAGTTLMSAWDNIFNIVDEARPIITNARSKQEAEDPCLRGGELPEEDE